MFELRILGPEDAPELQRVLEMAPTFFLLVRGRAASSDEAFVLFSDLPPGKTLADKTVFGIEVAGLLVGCVETMRGFPQPTTTMIGLLLIAETYQRRGLGAAVVAAIEAHAVRGWRSARMRIGVVDTNGPALAFWQARGYRPTGQRRPHREGSVTAEVLFFEKPLDVLKD